MQLLIVYHSQSGSCARLAAAAARGSARVDGLGSTLKRAWDCAAPDVVRCDGLLLVTAENSGRLSGGTKDFLDRVFYPLIERDCVRPYALLVSAGNDGRNAVEEARRIFRGIPFPEAVEPLILRGEVTASTLAEAEALGEAYGTGLTLGIF